MVQTEKHCLQFFLQVHSASRNHYCCYYCCPPKKPCEILEYLLLLLLCCFDNNYNYHHYRQFLHKTVHFQGITVIILLIIVVSSIDKSASNMKLCWKISCCCSSNSICCFCYCFSLSCSTVFQNKSGFSFCAFFKIRLSQYFFCSSYKSLLLGVHFIISLSADRFR